jgi:endonuclease III
MATEHPPTEASRAKTRHVRAVERLLRHAYGKPWHFNKRDPLGELVFIILSTQTREPEYRRTFAALWQRYRSWNAVRVARAHEIERLIRLGGFARRKTKLLKALLEKVYADRGTTSLRMLRRMDDATATAYLLELPGVGPKTAKCVLMYSLGRAVLPVDTHVWRVSRRLGWIEGARHPSHAGSDCLERLVPPRLRVSIHVTMVAHGRVVCRELPRCSVCVLDRLCPKMGVGWSGSREGSLRKGAVPLSGTGMR